MSHSDPDKRTHRASVRRIGKRMTTHPKRLRRQERAAERAARPLLYEHSGDAQTG